jgi:hypothetical protein
MAIDICGRFRGDQDLVSKLTMVVAAHRLGAVATSSGDWDSIRA